MVTLLNGRRRKAGLHISVDAGLKVHLQIVAERMNVPVSHLTSLALSRAVISPEGEPGLVLQALEPAISNLIAAGFCHPRQQQGHETSVSPVEFESQSCLQ
jgi:hypothetical protein